MFASSPVAQPISSDCPHPSTSRNGGASFARAANVHAWSNPLAGPELLDRVETAERPREEEGVKLRWTLSSKKTRGGGGVLRSETLMQWAMNGESGLKVMISPFKTSSRISRRPQKPVGLRAFYRLLRPAHERSVHRFGLVSSPFRQ